MEDIRGTVDDIMGAVDTGRREYLELLVDPDCACREPFLDLLDALRGKENTVFYNVADVRVRDGSAEVAVRLTPKGPAARRTLPRLQANPDGTWQMRRTPTAAWVVVAVD